MPLGNLELKFHWNSSKTKLEKDAEYNDGPIPVFQNDTISAFVVGIDNDWYCTCWP